MIIEDQIQIDNAVLMELPQLESESETENSYCKRRNDSWYGYIV